MRIRAEKIGSVTRRLDLPQTLTIGASIDCCEGAVLAGRVLNDKSVYNTLEDVHGRMMPLRRGDLVVGALGRRQALHGYAGYVPERLAAGEQVQLLNLGGVLGCCTSQNPDVGPPFNVEILGQVLRFPEFESRRGVPANIAAVAAAPAPNMPSCPVILVCGACMNSGKTVAASALVSRLTDRGLRIGGAKLTGVALLRDCLMLRDYGAACAFDFTDAGFPSTAAQNAVAAARCIFALLAEQPIDAAVIEMGDGIFGNYGVQEILADPALRGLASAIVYCANDPAGAYGGVRELKEHYGLLATVVSGPVTDNLAGQQFVTERLMLPALNARQQPGELADLVEAAIAAAIARTSEVTNAL